MKAKKTKNSSQSSALLGNCTVGAEIQLCLYDSKRSTRYTFKKRHVADSPGRSFNSSRSLNSIPASISKKNKINTN